MTFVNDDLLANRRLGEVEEFWYRSSGGSRIQGWIVRPPDYDPAKKYPLLLEIHGGPHVMYNVAFNPSAFGRNMITEILDIAATPVKEIMTPRPAVKAVEIGMTRDQVLGLVRSEGFSRYPVYRGRLDHIEGLIHAKDILSALVDRADFDLPALVRKPFFVPESAPVEKALLQMQQNAVHFAFVVDEFGNMEGIVTLEDILEEIVGDIAERHEFQVPGVRPQADGAWLIDGTVTIRDLNREFDWKLPDEPAATIAGLVMHESRVIPDVKYSPMAPSAARSKVLERWMGGETAPVAASKPCPACTAKVSIFMITLP